MFRVRDFLMFVAMALLIMVQINVQVNCAPAVIKPGCRPCPPCRGIVARRVICNIACPACAY
ncbi:5350_t:CDS:2 [Racocetra persica]|uniref:5350_t:CDS:1 n=1 Tax=Racocetra persica TaxID=160502 RepID=A0ACA9MSU2_9GLOM|nr:5350_t:CDS:2 [Racocetra persica]